MFSRVLGDPEQVPVAQNNRLQTDCICCATSAIFALALFILAIIAFAGSSVKDDNHFLDIPNIRIREQQSSDISRHDFEGFLATILWSAVFSLGIGLLWMVVVHFAPMYAPKIAIFLAFSICVFIAVFTFMIKNNITSTHPWLLYVFAGIVIFVVLNLGTYFLVYQNEQRFQSIFLRYAVRFLNQRPSNFILILAFLLFTCGLTALCVFQHLAFSRKYHNNNNFFDFGNPGALGILNIIQFFWGLKFLQDAFIFILSGNAVDYYWRREGSGKKCFGLSNLIIHNWGSVVAGSFINLVFKVPSLLFQLLICHPTGCCNKCGNLCYDSCGHYILNLVRTDAYAFINIFGSGYCESARQCQNLCLDQLHFQGSQSPLRNYRIVCQILQTATSFAACYFILRHRVDQMSVWFVVELLVVVTAISYYFGSLHASVAQGLMVCFMVEYQLQGQYDYMHKIVPEARNDLKTLSRRAKRDGNC